MAKFSTHILNSVNGTHASNITIIIYKTDSTNNKVLLLKDKTDNAGRFIKEFILNQEDCKSIYEMTIGTEEYFGGKNKIVQEINVKFKMEDPEKEYHIPIIISPNGYSIWWSD